MDDCVFAVEFTNDGLTAAFVGPDGSEEGKAGFDLADFVDGESESFDRLVALLTAKAKATRGAAKAVAVSLPCDIDARRRTIVDFPQAKWLNGKALPETLENSIGLPTVMERRAVVLLAYDRIMLGLPDNALTMGCYISLHYESAIYHNGRPIIGKNGTAGNLGHFTIHDREDQCFCGKSGCVDLYGAGLRLKQMHKMIFPDTPIDELFVHHGGHPILRDYLSMMAYPIAMTANILDPDFIVLGGAIPSMAEFPRQTLEDEIRRHSYTPSGLTFLASTADMAVGLVSTAQYARMELGLL